MKSILDIFTRGFILFQKTAFFATALLFAFSLFAQAEMVDTYQFQNQDDRTRAVELAKSLRCPQCQNQNFHSFKHDKRENQSDSLYASLYVTHYSFHLFPF